MKNDDELDDLPVYSVGPCKKCGALPIHMDKDGASSGQFNDKGEIICCDKCSPSIFKPETIQ